MRIPFHSYLLGWVETTAVKTILGSSLHQGFNPLPDHLYFPKEIVMFKYVGYNIPQHFAMWVWVKIQDLGDHRHSQFLVFTIQLLGYPSLTHTHMNGRWMGIWMGSTFLMLDPCVFYGEQDKAICGQSPPWFRHWFLVHVRKVFFFFFLNMKSQLGRFDTLW